MIGLTGAKNFCRPSCGREIGRLRHDANVAGFPTGHIQVFSIILFELT